MTPYVTATCRDCDTVAVHISAVTLNIGDGTLSFLCPHCSLINVQPSPCYAEQALIHHGCQLVVA